MLAPVVQLCKLNATFWRATESQRQYWQVKHMYRDVILFFKVGKFYEVWLQPVMLLMTDSALPTFWRK